MALEKDDLDRLFDLRKKTPVWNCTRNKSKELDKASSYIKQHLKRVRSQAQDEMEKLKILKKSEKRLKMAFVVCAKFHYVYCDAKESLEEDLWKNFLDTVCELYDNLLAWKELYYWSYQTDNDGEAPNSHRTCDSNICQPIEDIEAGFRDNRDGRLYKLHDSGDGAYYCDVKNVIYLITCEGDDGKCDKRYVGKTVQSLKQRYPKGDKAKELDHFQQNGHGEVFRILQIVREADLFPSNDSFCEYVRDNPSDLEGLESIWINALTTKGKDLNTKYNFKYSDKHRLRMSELLRFFVCKHEIKYVKAGEFQRLSIEPKTKQNEWALGPEGTRGTEGIDVAIYIIALFTVVMLAFLYNDYRLKADSEVYVNIAF